MRFEEVYGAVLQPRAGKSFHHLLRGVGAGGVPLPADHLGLAGHTELGSEVILGLGRGGVDCFLALSKQGDHQHLLGGPLGHRLCFELANQLFSAGVQIHRADQLEQGVGVGPQSCGSGPFLPVPVPRPITSFLSNLFFTLEIAGKKKSNCSQLQSSQSSQNCTQTSGCTSDKGEVQGGVVGDGGEGAQTCGKTEHTG